MAMRPASLKHLTKYTMPEDVPQLIMESVDEIEFHLKIQFPEVYEAARERYLARHGIF